MPIRQYVQGRLLGIPDESHRAGFKKSWQENDYTTIVTVARKIPGSILQDEKLLMWFDQALTCIGGGDV